MTHANGSKKLVLCTGGMGYIGSHTVIKLIEYGFDVLIVDNLINSDKEVLNRLKKITGIDVPFVEADIADHKAMDSLFKKFNVSAVIHFAALKAVGESVEKPLMYYRNNVSGTISLLESMVANNVKTLVFSSSATVYLPSLVPLKEDAPLGCSNPYGQTKRMMEIILEDLCKSDPEWRVELLRYFNPVGAHPSGLIGEDPQGIPNNLMPYIQQVGVGRRPHLNVFGNDYPESEDGTGVRDYIHVEDLADAHVRALELLLRTPGQGATVHNLGTGRGSSVLEMVKAFEKASGKPIPYKIAPRRPGDLGRVICNPDKAKAELGWTAQRDMDVIMEDSWRWQSQNPTGFKST
jgi:UDP-glucose 4-epimerase